MAERLFLGIELDDDIRHATATHLEASLAGERLPGKPVPVENWHLTLRFLGTTEPLQRDQVLQYLDEHLVVEPFRVRLGGLGGFPRESRASVLWLGVDGDVQLLESVAATCEGAAQIAGFEPEGRPFHPHVTLARIRPPVDIRALVDSVPPLRRQLDIEAVTLYRSLLGRGPARYEVVERVLL